MKCSGIFRDVLILIMYVRTHPEDGRLRGDTPSSDAFESNREHLTALPVAKDMAR
jgi:hypothetical protein